MSQNQEQSGLEFLVHGKLGPCVVVPGTDTQAFELWVVPTPEMEAFSTLVSRQSGITILGNHVWFFRPIDIPVQEGDKTVMMKKMLALDGGCFPDGDIKQIRQNGIKVRRHPSTSDPLSGFLIVTPGDVMDLPSPIIFSQIQFSGGPQSVEGSSTEEVPAQSQQSASDQASGKAVETTYTPPPRSKIKVQPSVIEGTLDK